jgi:hypothetical protein
MKRIYIIIFTSLLGAVSCASAQTAFQPYNAQGDNLIHVTTADFDGVGVNDYVVGMSIEGKVIAFQRPDLIVDPASASNRLWEYQTPCSFNIMIAAGDANTNSPGDEVLIPGTDGHVRILSSSGVLLGDWTVSSGALYCVGVGQTSAGAVRVIVGGVDGDLHIHDDTGSSVGTVRPDNVGIIRRVVVGNFDGIGGDEVMVFYSRTGYAAYRYIELYDLDTLARPAYWDLTEPMEDDVAYIYASPGMGWTDKQTAWAYDMDGDGDDEVVANWGVMHPENGGTNTLLSAALPEGEKLYLSEYEDFAEPTPTGKYLLQQGVPGNFRDSTANAEMFTLYGDDLYLVDYDGSRSVNTDRFRIIDYSYAHTLYHFTDGARLEDRNGGPDKIVLAGPAHGDDHFYVVDLNTSQWKEQAKTIDGNGVLGAVRDTLDDLEDDIDAFNGTVAEAGRPIYYINYFRTYLGWPMTPEKIESHADDALAAMQEARDRLGGTAGYMPERVRFVSSMYGTKIWGAGSQSTDPDITAAGVEAFCAALAQRGVHFCVSLGHHNIQHMTPETLADCFEASVVDGECYLMGLTGEQEKADYVDTYKPHMDAVIDRAQLLGIEPPRLVMTSKGPIFSAMSPTQASTWFPAYKKVFTPSIECSNNTLPEFCYAEQVGLWLSGAVDGWCSSLIGDNLTANRIAEWGGVRNGHVVLRHMLSQYSLGADIFRVTSIVNQENPLYERGDTTDPELDLANPYRQGVWNFLKIVEAGAYPNGPDRNQLKGISPVAAAMPAPNATSLELNAIKHDYTKYSTHARPQTYVLNGLSCWDGYTDVPDFDITAILHNTKRRWDNLLPTSPCGFVPIVPHASRAAVETNAWCERAYETDVDTWGEFPTLEIARDAISAELLAQRTNMLFYVDGECFWQVTENKDDPDRLFVLAMDSTVLTPTARAVELMKGAADGVWDVYDQLGSSSTPLGTLASEIDTISIGIPAGSVRILVLKKRQPITPTVMGIAWDGATAPSLAINGIDGVIVPSNQGLRDNAGSLDGYFGPDDGYAGASTAANDAYQVKDYEDNPATGWISVAITNNTGSTLQLETLLFDYGQWYAASPTNVSVYYRSGDLSSVSSNTPLANLTVIASVGWIQGDYDDFTVPLTNLTDSSLAPGEHAVFELRATVGTTAAGGFDNIAILISGLGNYDAWAASFGLYASNAWSSVDLEPDGLDNWTEYLLGGDPTVADAAAILPSGGIVPEMGTNWLEYVYRRRSDYEARGLNYTVEATTNLVSNLWSTNGVVDGGFGAIDVEMDSVTNRVSTEEQSEQFIRLRVW